MDSSDDANDGDLAKYSAQSFLQAQSGNGHRSDDDPDDQPPPSGLGAVWFLIKAIFLTLFGYLKFTLETYPFISFWFTWAFIILGICSIATRWFIHHFAYSVFRPFSWTSLVSIFMPISLPATWLTAAVFAFHGARIEECRGSSYLLCFIIIITGLTQTTVVCLRLIVQAYFTGDPKNFWFFDSYGWDFLPFSLVMLHGWLVNHPYITIFGFPLRVHMTPALYTIGLLYGVTHGLRITMTIPIALTWTWLLKYVWLSQTYSRLTGLLLTPVLCKLGGTLQRFIPWQYNPSLNDQQQMDETKEMYLVSQQHSYTQYVIGLKTSEHYGELQATETILHRPLDSQYAQLHFPNTNTQGNGYYSSTSSSSSNTGMDMSDTGIDGPGSSSGHNGNNNNNNHKGAPSNPPSVNFDALVVGSSGPQPDIDNHHDENDATINITPEQQHRRQQRTPSNSSQDDLSGVALYHYQDPYTANSRRRFGSEGSPLIEGGDQNCFDCAFMESTGVQHTAKDLLEHLKFKSFIFSHSRREMNPKQVQYTTVRDRSYYYDGLENGTGASSSSSRVR
jgi:hypothetical protein